MRVVSLLPSATETLCAILGSDEGGPGAGSGGSSGGSSGGGAGVLLVGRSHECDYPSHVLDRPALTGQAIDFDAMGAAGVDSAVSTALASGRSLYSLDEAALAALRPDLILTQDLCEVCSIDLASVRRAAGRLSPRPQVLSLNPLCVEDVLDDVLRIGRAVGHEARAERVMVGLRERLHAAADHVNPYEAGPRVLFLEWTDPPFVGGHWTPELIERAGASHPLNPSGVWATAASADHGGAGAGADPLGSPMGPGAGKSRRITPEEIVASEPDAVVVCPCGLDLARARRELAGLKGQAWFRALPGVRAGRIAVVDGSQMFNRPGPRLVDAFEWLVGWLHDRPELIPVGFPWERGA